MAKDRLVVDVMSGEYRIVWFLAEQGEYGAVLGEEEFSERDVEGASDSDVEHVRATISAKATQGVSRDTYGYFWPSEKEAKAALRTVKTAVALGAIAKAWPDWALKAQAAGWSPPKGWKP